MGGIDLDPCADEGRHVNARSHFTHEDDGLSQQWHGRVFMNPPYSCPGKWMAKLQSEVESGRVREAIALVPAATDTNWLSPVLETQPVCFWKGRIKFLDTNYQPKLPARQSHILVYWGNNPQNFKQVFKNFGIVMNVEILPPSSPAKKNFSNQIGEVLQTHYSVYLPEEDMTVQFSSDEVKFMSQDKPFQFSQTQAIANQIAQLQEQLNQLTEQLKPYQQCEQKAEDLRVQVAEYGHEMTAAGIPQDDILNWAKSLYEAAACQKLELGDSSVIASQNGIIAELKSELTVAKKQKDQANSERIEAMTVLEETTAQRDKAFAKISGMSAGQMRVAQKLKSLRDENANLVAQTDEAAIEVLRKENAALVAKIKQLEKLPKEQLIPTETVETTETIEEVDHSRDIEAQNRAHTFISSVRTKTGLNNITWQDISKVCQGEIYCFRKLSLAAKSKLQKELIQRMPQLLTDYICETGDMTDFEWLGDRFKSKVNTLLEAKKSLFFQPYDYVKVNETGEVWQVKSFDGEWLSARKDNRITNLHHSEVSKAEAVEIAF